MKAKFDSYETLGTTVDSNSGVLTVEMGQLRDVHGAGKLGSTVVASIHDKLESIGLGHSPSDLPTYQGEPAIIYRKGTPVARLIEAVNSVGAQSASVLREFASKDSKASEIVQRIKDIVCD